MSQGYSSGDSEPTVGQRARVVFNTTSSNRPESPSASVNQKQSKANPPKRPTKKRQEASVVQRPRQPEPKSQDETKVKQEAQLTPEPQTQVQPKPQDHRSQPNPQDQTSPKGQEQNIPRLEIQSKPTASISSATPRPRDETMPKSPGPLASKMQEQPSRGRETQAMPFILTAAEPTRPITPRPSERTPLLPRHRQTPKTNVQNRRSVLEAVRKSHYPLAYVRR